MRSLILCTAHIAFRALANITQRMFYTQSKWGAILTQHMCFCVFEQKNELLRQRCPLFPEIGINTMRFCICVLVFRPLQLHAYQYAICMRRQHSTNTIWHKVFAFHLFHNKSTHMVSALTLTIVQWQQPYVCVVWFHCLRMHFRHFKSRSFQNGSQRFRFN